MTYALDAVCAVIHTTKQNIKQKCMVFSSIGQHVLFVWVLSLHWTGLCYLFFLYHDVLGQNWHVPLLVTCLAHEQAALSL